MPSQEFEHQMPILPNGSHAADLEAQEDDPASANISAKDEGHESHSSSIGSTGIDSATARLDWDSPEDIDNPQLWSAWKKVFHVAIPALFGFVLTIGTSTYVPAIPYIMEEYKVGREVAVLPLSLYTLGFTVGPLFAGPLSELYGRRIIYQTTMPLLVVFTAIAAASNNLPVLIIFRLLAGLGGSGALSIGAGTIADLYSHEERGRAAILFIIAPFLGPSLGPLTGAYIIAEYNEQYRFGLWVILFVAAPVVVAMLFMQETSKHRILTVRYKARADKTVPETSTRLLIRKLKVALTRPFTMMIREPLVAFLSIYTGFAFAMMFSFFGSYNYVFQLVYHFNQKQIGLTFLGLLVGFLFAIATFGVFDATLYRKAVVRSHGRPAPEHRLYAALLGSFMLPIGLFWFSWSPREDVHWIVPVLAGVPFGWGCLSIFISAITYLVDVYQAANSASAVAANGTLRYGLGAVLPLFTVQMYSAMGVHWAGSVFAFVSLAFLPVPWIFYWKGKVLRDRSLYDTFKE